MVMLNYDPARDITVVTVTGGSKVEVIYDTPQQPVKDVTPDGKPLIVLAS